MIARRTFLRRPRPAPRPHRDRPAWRCAPAPEGLETRSLLSPLPRPIAHLRPPFAVSVQHEAPRRAHFTTHNPLNEKVVGGHVAKHPRFYSEYSGPRLASLNGNGAIGRLILGVGYQFTGRVVGPIDPARQAYYVFGVDRGGGKAPMSIMPPSAAGGKQGGTTGGGSPGGTSLETFPRRPNIFIDATVTVAVGPSGPSGAVQLMQPDGGPGSVTPLPPGDIRISGNEVTVLVDPHLLPPNGLPADQYFYGFWARTGLYSPGQVASFVPEYNITPIDIVGPAHAPDFAGPLGR